MKLMRPSTLAVAITWIVLAVPCSLSAYIHVAKQSELQPTQQKQRPRTSGTTLYGNAKFAYSIRYIPHFGEALPRLTRFPSPTVMRKVNQDLAHEDRSKRNNADDCINTMPNHSGSWNQHVHVVLFTHQILSIARDTLTGCGAYPETFHEPLTYDLSTGERFDFNRDAYKLFRPSEFDYSKLLDLYRSHYKSDSADCDVSMLSEVRRMDLYFDKWGLVEIPADLPHVIQACGPPLTIPFGELRELVRPDNPFSSLFDRIR